MDVRVAEFIKAASRGNTLQLSIDALGQRSSFQQTLSARVIFQQTLSRTLQLSTDTLERIREPRDSRVIYGCVRGRCATNQRDARTLGHTRAH